MIFLRRAEHLPIGVDLGHERLKLLQLRERNGNLSVLAAAQRSTEDLGVSGLDRVACLVPQVKQLISASGFYGRHVVAVLPRELVQVKTIRLPALPEAEMRVAIETEARALFTTPPEQLSIRFIPAGEVRHGADVRQEVIVLAVQTEAVERLLEQFHQAGLIVDSLDFEPAAIYRGVERFVRRKEDESDVTVLVDIGACQSQVVIGRGREVTFVKTIDIGGQKISDCVARKLSLSLSEAASLRRRFATTQTTEKDSVRQTVLDATRSMISDLAHEVSLCLRYYSVTFRGQRPSKLRLMGGEANDPTIRSAMSQSLTVPIEVYQPFQGIATAQTPIANLDGSLGEWGVCFGAALRKVHNQVMRDPNAVPAYGRRKSDAAVVEVVDLSTAIKSAGVMETHDSRRTRNEEVSHA